MTSYQSRLIAALTSGGESHVHFDANPLHMALLAGDRQRMDDLLKGDRTGAAVKELHRLAEHGYVSAFVDGQAVDLALVAWPFIVSYGERGGRVPSKFDMGLLSEPTGQLVRNLWHQVLDEEACVGVIPMRLGLHAHTIYGVCPDDVQVLVQRVADAISSGREFVPTGLDPAESREPKDAVGPIQAPVLLMAAVLVRRGHAIAFKRSAIAMNDARQLITAKLGLPTGSPSVLPLEPALFFDAIEDAISSENLAMVLWEGGSGVRTDVQMHWDGQCSRILSRAVEIDLQQGGARTVQTQAFDLRWLDPAIMRKSVDDMRAVIAQDEVRQFYLAQAGAWADPFRLN